MTKVNQDSQSALAETTIIKHTTSATQNDSNGRQIEVNQVTEASMQIPSYSPKIFGVVMFYSPLGLIPMFMKLTM